MDLARVRERLYGGRYSGREVVRPADGEWGPMEEWPQLRGTLQLKGIEVGPARHKGWKKPAKPAPLRAAPPSPRAVSVAPPTPTAPTAPAAPKVAVQQRARPIPRRKKTPSIWPTLVVVAGLVAAAAWFLS